MSMIEVKTSDLIGLALDWAVAKAANIGDPAIDMLCCGSGVQSGYGSPPECCGKPDPALYLGIHGKWSPSTDWAQGGPLLDEHCKGFGCVQNSLNSNWRAFGYGNGKPFDQDRQQRLASGPSILIAACRAIVAAKLGDVVIVPAELVEA